MKTKIYSVLGAALMLSSVSFAQKNVIKVKPIRPIVQVALGAPLSIPIAYERVIIPRLSAQLNFTYQLSSTLDVGQLDFGNVTPPTLSGWGIGPEVRFYPNITKDTPRGFFLAGFLNYSKSNIETGFSFEQDLDFGLPGGTKIPYTTELGLTGYFNRLNYGIAIGSQWLIADRVSIEVQWLRLGWGTANIGVDIEGDLVDMNQINSKLNAAGYPPVSSTAAGVPTWKDVDASFSESLDETTESLPSFLGADFSTSSTTSSLNANLKTNMPAFALFGFSLGFAF